MAKLKLDAQVSLEVVCRDAISLQGNDTALVSFSAGKDAISMTLGMLESGLFSKYLLVYYYLVPGLSFVDRYIRYFEEKTGLAVQQVPNPTFYKMRASAALQTPKMAEALKAVQVSGDGYLTYTIDSMFKAIKKYYQIESAYCAVGIKKADGYTRRVALNKSVINEKSKKYYPMAEWTIEDIRTQLKRFSIDLPEEYPLFRGISFDGFAPRFLGPIKQHFPEDYRRICEYFPETESILYRKEKYGI